MKYTLLDLTQNVLSSMDSDEINSINDTVESQQVVKIIKTVYDDIIARSDLPFHKAFFNLIPSGDSTKPTLMTKPDNITHIDWLKYNTIKLGDTVPNWHTLDYLSPEDFIDRVQNFNTADITIGTMTITANGFTVSLNYYNNAGPNYYTAFDDNTIIFDGYDSEVDSTLQSIKTIGSGTRNLVWNEIDGFVPELQADQFALLLNEAKSLAWAELKQAQHPKAERTAQKNWVHLAKNRVHIPRGEGSSGNHIINQPPHFGRKP